MRAMYEKNSLHYLLFQPYSTPLNIIMFIELWAMQHPHF